MSLAQRLASPIITSSRLRAVRHSVARARRRLRRAPRGAEFFWDVADPYAGPALALLAPLAERHALAVRVLIVPPPDQAAAPEAERLAAYARADAARLAAALGLPPIAPAPPATLATAEAIALTAVRSGATLTSLAALAQRIGAGLPVEGRPAPPEECAAARGEGAALRARAGHYLGSVTHFEGEHYWGVDRLHHLEARLAAETGAPTGLCPLLEPRLPGEPAAPQSGPVLDFYLSFRSPYTLIAAERIGTLADHYGARLRLRFVLPMVMRGLPVPPPKRRYILLDTKREAARQGLAFGTVVDPVGRGVERGLAVLHAAIARGRGLAFAQAFLRGAFAHGRDMRGAGLVRTAGEVGISAAEVSAALADESWRAEAEANRAALFALGLWGVPSFQVGTRAPLWGQDRLWAVEDDLRAERGLAALERRWQCAG